MGESRRTVGPLTVEINIKEARPNEYDISEGKNTFRDGTLLLLCYQAGVNICNRVLEGQKTAQYRKHHTPDAPMVRLTYNNTDESVMVENHTENIFLCSIALQTMMGLAAQRLQQASQGRIVRPGRA